MLERRYRRFLLPVTTAMRWLVLKIYEIIDDKKTKEGNQRLIKGPYSTTTTINNNNNKYFQSTFNKRLSSYIKIFIFVCFYSTPNTFLLTGLTH